MRPLRNAIFDAIDQGRVGRPRFIRCVVTVSAGEQLDAALSEYARFAGELFGSNANRSYAMESNDVYRSNMLKWSEGQSALLIASVGAPHLDIMLLGSRGAIYHEE